MCADSSTNTSNSQKKMHVSIVTSLVSCVTCVLCHLSSVTCCLITTLWSISRYESPRRFGEACFEGLEINRVSKSIYFYLSRTNFLFHQYFVAKFKEEQLCLEVSNHFNKKLHRGDRQEDIATCKLNRPRARFSGGKNTPTRFFFKVLKILDFLREAT